MFISVSSAATISKYYFRVVADHDFYANNKRACIHVWTIPFMCMRALVCAWEGRVVREMSRKRDSVGLLILNITKLLMSSGSAVHFDQRKR